MPRDPYQFVSQEQVGAKLPTARFPQVTECNLTVFLLFLAESGAAKLQLFTP